MVFQNDISFLPTALVCLSSLSVALPVHERQVVVEATVDQGRNNWTKSKQVYLPSYQTGKVEIIFEEVKMLGAKPTYNIRTYSLGSLK